MALYYTIDEFIEVLSTELQNLNVYQQMLRSIATREASELKQGTNWTIINADMTVLLTDADTVLQAVETALTVGSNSSIDFANYAFEIRAGVGSYHHAFISIVTPALTSWTITSNNPEGVSFAVFETLLAATNTVEIFNVGDSDLEGFFVIIGNSTSSIQLAEADHLSEAQEIPSAFDVIVRLRETV